MRSAARAGGMAAGGHALSTTTVMQLPALMLERVRHDPVLSSRFGGEGSLSLQNSMLKTVLAELSAGMAGEDALLIDDFRKRELQAGLTNSDVVRWGDLLVDSLREAGVEDGECNAARLAVARIIEQTEWRDHLDRAIRHVEGGCGCGCLDRDKLLGHLYAVRQQLSAPAAARLRRADNGGGA